VQCNDFCEICKRPLSQDAIDWERWETTGRLVHKNCVTAKSSVKATGRNVKKYPDKNIPPELAKKIIKDNTI
jgi:hypothetical protein